MKWTDPHAAQALSYKRDELSWRAFPKEPAMLLLTSTAECCLLLFYISPSPMGNGLSGGVSSFNPGLYGSRWDKARVGLACVITGGWLVLLGGRVVVMTFHCLWFATPVLCFHHSPLVVVVYQKDLELDVGL